MTRLDAGTTSFFFTVRLHNGRLFWHAPFSIVYPDIAIILTRRYEKVYLVLNSVAQLHTTEWLMHQHDENSAGALVWRNCTMPFCGRTIGAKVAACTLWIGAPNKKITFLDLVVSFFTASFFFDFFDFSRTSWSLSPSSSSSEPELDSASDPPRASGA